MRVSLLLVVLLAAPALAAEDPCLSGGGTKLADGCGGYEGSCCSLDRGVRYWCVTYGQDGDQKATCSAACGGATCGWRCDRNPLGGECITYPVSLGSYECGQPLAPDPTGENPWTCTALCAPQCGGKNCGPDGCGAEGQQGVCGQCATDPTSSCPMACTAAGKCDKVCADCAALGWTCGSNCCGGVCGSCTPPATCDPASHTCSCTPSCAGKACGPDGCGGSCGACAGALVCVDGACAPAVTEGAPEAIDGDDDPGPPPDPGANPDPGGSGDGRVPEPSTAEVAPDGSGASDGGCPDGTSYVSGLCLKDPPKGTGTDGDGGGGCWAGPGAPPAAGWLALLALAWLALRRRGARG